MDDTIYRQAAISAICNACGKIDCDKMDKCEKLQLSPANISETPNSSDTISRQQAIDTLENTKTAISENGERYIAKQNAIMRIDALPSAQPKLLQPWEVLVAQAVLSQPKMGKWLYCEDTTADCVDGYRCDQCGFFVPWDYQHKSIDYIKDYNFCPNCGADMRQREE